MKIAKRMLKMNLVKVVLLYPSWTSTTDLVLCLYLCVAGASLSSCSTSKLCLKLAKWLHRSRQVEIHEDRNDEQ